MDCPLSNYVRLDQGLDKSGKIEGLYGTTNTFYLDSVVTALFVISTKETGAPSILLDRVLAH